MIVLNNSISGLINILVSIMIRSGLLANYIIAVYNTIDFLLCILPRDSSSDTIHCVGLFGSHLAPISYIYKPINGLLLFIILSELFIYISYMLYKDPANSASEIFPLPHSWKIPWEEAVPHLICLTWPHLTWPHFLTNFSWPSPTLPMIPQHFVITWKPQILISQL